MELKTEYVERIRKSDLLLLALAKANDVRVTSIERWLRKRNKLLTAASNLAIIKNHFKVVDVADLLEAPACSESLSRM